VDTPPGRLDRVSGRAQLIACARCQDNISAGLGQGERARSTNAASSAGNHGDPAVEPETI
jgi:hypothetical protein